MSAPDLSTIPAADLVSNRRVQRGLAFGNLLTAADVASATDDHLLALPGIARWGCRALRQAIADRTSEAAT